MPASSPESPKPGPSWLPRRSSIVVGFLLAVVALALLLVDRRGDRILPTSPVPADSGPPRMPELPPSSIGLQVIYELEEAFAAVEAATPSRIGNLSERRVHPQNRRVTHALALSREPLEMSLRGDTIHASTTIRYRGRVWFDSPVGGEFSASCRDDDGSPGPRAIVRLRSPLDLDPDWNLRTRVEVLEVIPASEADRDRCVVSLGPLRMDVTDALLSVAEARLEEAALEIDALFQRFDLGSSVEARWAQLQQPIPLGPDSWLTVEVDSVVVEELSGRRPDGNELTARLAMVGRPRIVMGRRRDSRAAPLPRLVEGSVPDDFVALVDAEVGYEEASRLLGEALGGRTVEVAGRSVQIVDALVFGAGGGRVALEVEVDGAVRGRLYLVGTPVLDQASGEVTVPDLQFSVSSRNVLLEGAAWLLRGTFPDLVRRRLRWNVEGATRRLAALSRRSLDRRISETVRIEGTVTSVRMLGVAAGEESFFVRSQGEGTLRFHLGPVTPSPSPSTTGAGDF